MNATAHWNSRTHPAFPESCEPPATHTLVDALWDDDPPRTAREQVMNCLGCIRRAIASSCTEEVSLDRVRDGYAFGIEAERIDHVVFSRLCAEA
ncbi:AfsR/SARP family transcriptional regulator [Streptomyces tibetensis]|uniref:AfsR/SARP family transcriptional regulator n=1 Tax=Streptomyces tibetensis TaxID=2382123 RepID=UPI0033CAC9BC